MREPDPTGTVTVERAWEHAGVLCEIVRMGHVHTESAGPKQPRRVVRTPGHLCARVRVPAGHPWDGLERAELRAEFHGLLTFAGERRGQLAPPPTAGWWVGFHTQTEDRFEWTLEQVVDELQAVAERVAEVGAVAEDRRAA